MYENISPLDYRYINKHAREYLSEDAFMRYQLNVEAALVAGFAKHGLCSKKIAAEVQAGCAKVTAADVYEEDARIKHSTRALVNCIRNNVSDEAKPFIHFTTTSFDIVDSANAARYKDFTNNVLAPAIKDLLQTLITLAEREKATVQIGRTHGQHAVPITFGYAIAEYVDRIGNTMEKIQAAGDDLRGKIAGAVGSHNGQALFIKDPLQFEKDVLQELGIQPSPHSTQVVEPEYTLTLLHHVVSCYGILANLADDMRHLQRSEIGEVAEQFGKNQVGSSTMPHKRNPWNYENIKSLWKETMPRLMTHYMDQICEHQRDLSNSASARFIPEIFALFLESVTRMNTIMSRVIVDKENIQQNLDDSKELVIAEAFYLLLAFHGHPDAHEYIRVQTLEVQKTGTPLRELIAADASVKKYTDKFTNEQQAIVNNPEAYTGICTKKTELLCKKWRKHA
ncbi:MAG: lyase family protein [Candidatus Woesearchaeota archaeon]|nr:lyase family protein [Candidatus Woesearchaeota archaeon]